MAYLFAALVSTASAQFTYTEDFKNDTAAGWVLDPAGNSSIEPLLTSGAIGRAGDPEGLGNTIDPTGSGWLRMTNETNNLHNAVYFDTPIPSAGNSVNITFGFNAWGGNDLLNTGADGLTFFLYDASKPFVVGANGGSIGYAQKDQGTLGAIDAADDHNGLNGGWVGIALDAYGNYSRAAEGRQGGTAGGGALNPNTVVARGPGTGLDGYDFLASTGYRDYTDTGDATTLDGTDGTVPNLPYTMAFSDATERPNQSNQYRNVSITFDENSQLRVKMQFGEDGLWYDVLDVDLSSFVRPEQLKMGFASGTGSGTQVYEIGGLLTVTATAGSGNFIWDNGEGAGFKIWGTGANNPLNWAGNTNPTLKSNVMFNNTYVTTAQNIDVTGSDKVIKNMYFSGNHAYNLSTSDQRLLIFDSDSVGVPTSINLTNDAVAGNAAHTIAMNIQMNRNLEVVNNVSAATPFTISGNIDTNGNTLAMKGVGQSVLSGVISGNGALSKYTTGTTILSGGSANTYTGATNIYEGTLQIEKAGALGTTAAGTTVHSGGTLAINGTGFSIAESLSLNGTGAGNNGALNNLAGTNTWTGTVALAGDASIRTAAGSTLTLSGVVSGAAGNDLTKIGTGTLVLSGNNTYTGATNITAGTLAISNENNLGANPGSFNAAQLNLDGGTLRTQTNTVSIDDANRGVTIGAGGGTFDTQSNLSILTAVTGAGTLTKEGSGTLTLSATNTHTGDVNVNQGTLLAQGGSALGNSAAVSIAGGATLSTAGYSETVGSIAGAGAVDLGTGSTMFTTGGNNTSTTFSGVIGGGANADLTKQGTGTMTLTGINTMTGDVTVSGGGLTLAATGGNSALGSVSNITVNNGATLALGADNQINNLANLILNGGTFVSAGFDETMRQLQVGATASAIDYLNDGSVLRFNGAAGVSGLGTLSNTLTIANWAGSITGNGTEQLVIYSHTGSAPSVANITFADWGAASTITRNDLGAGYYEIVPLATGTQWGVNGNGNWNNDVGNWRNSSSGASVAQPNGTGTIAILGNYWNGSAWTGLTADPTITVGANRTVGKLIFENSNNRSYTISGGNRLDFDVAAGQQSQIIVNDDGAHTISTSSRYNDNMLVSNNSGNPGNGLTLSGAISLRDGDGNGGTGTNLLTFNGTGRTLVSGAISQSGTTGSLLKTGSGTLVLSGANSYSGTTTLRNGTLEITGNAPSGANGNLGNATSAVIVNDASTTATMNTALLMTDTNGGSSLNRVLTIGNYGAATTLGGTNTSGTNTFSGNVTLNRSVNLTAATGGTVSFSGVLSGAGGIDKVGGGTVTLAGTGANTFTGDVTVTTGTLNVGKTGAANLAIGDSAQVTVAGGASLVFTGGQSETIGSLAGAGNVNNTNANALTLTTGGNGLSTTLSGVISDTGGNISLTKTGTGALTLSGDNSYAGATSISQGRIVAQHTDALGDSGSATATTVTAGAALWLDLAGTNTFDNENLTLSGAGDGTGALRNLQGNNTWSGGLVLGATSTLRSDSGLLATGTSAITGTGFGLVVDGAGATTLNGSLNTGTGGTLTKNNSGYLTLNNSGNYTGATTINGGTVEIRNGTALGTTAGATTVNGGATLALSGGIITLENLTTYGQGVGSLGAIRNVGGTNIIDGDITFGSETYIGVDAGTNLALTGALGGTAGFSKQGDGILTLSSDDANTYDGTTAIAAGILEVRRSTSLGDVNATTIANGATLRIGYGGLSIDENITVTGAGFGGAGAIQNADGNNSLTGVITMTGHSTISSAAGTTLTLENGSVAGDFNLIKVGDGGLTMANAANSYSGTTTVRAGTLTVAADAPAGANGALGNSNSIVQLGDAGSTGAIALYAGNTSGGVEIDRQIAVNNYGTGTTFGGTNTSGTNTFTGNITLGKNATVTAASGGTVAVSGVIDGTGGLTKTGNGTVALSGANTYAGATTVSDGVLEISHSSALGSTAAGTTVSSGASLALSGGITVGAGESLTLAGNGHSGSIGALHNVSGNNSVAGAVTLDATNTTVSSASGTLTLSGNIGQTAGTRNLLTDGAGNIVLTGTGSFTGAATIDGTGNFTLANTTGQAFGSVSGVTINSGATLSLGADNQINDAAILTLAGGTFNVGGFDETMRQLVMSSSSAIDYLNDGSILRFNGVTGAGAGLGSLTGTLTINNWAGSLDGSGTEQLIVYKNTAGAPTVTSINFADWGGATTIARGDLGAGYYEIVPLVSGSEWNVDSATTQNWGTSGNWSPSGTPNAANAIAILGNTVGSPPLNNNITISMQTTNRVVGKLIFENGANRNYTVGTGTTGRLDFDVTTGQSQIIVNDDGSHTIAAASRYNDNMLVSNNSGATTGLTLSGAINLRDGDGTAGGTNLLTFNGSGRTVVSGVISQTDTVGSLVKTGSGTLALSGANSYTGTTTLRNGTLELAGNSPDSAAGNLGNAGSVVVINDSGTTASMSTSLLMTDANGGSSVNRKLRIDNYGAGTTLGGTNTSGTNTFTNSIDFNRDVKLTAAAGGTVALSGVIAGNGGIEKIGDGIVSLSGSTMNSFQGNVTVTAGTLSLDKSVNDGNIDVDAAVTVAAGATLRFNGGAGQIREAIGSLAGAGTVDNLQATALELRVGYNDASTVFSGNITDSGGALTLAKYGDGTLTLSGNNSYDGATNVFEGTLIAASNTALGNATLGTTVSQDATLGLQGNITITGEALSLAAKNAPNIASVANLSGINTFTGNISITGGTAGHDVKLDSAAGSQLTLSGVISQATNTKDISKTGGGAMVFSGANTYGGQTSVAAGTLIVSHNNALGAAVAGTTDDTFVQIGGTLAFDHATGVTIGSNEGITLYASANPAAPSLKNIGGSNTIQGNVAMSGGANTGVIIDTNAGTLNLAGVVSNGANANFITKTGTGTLTLSGAAANTYTGATNINDGTLLLNKTAGLNAVGPGALNIGDSIGAINTATVRLSASNQINNATNITIATDGLLDLQTHSDAVGAVTMAGGSIIADNTTPGTLTLGGNLTFNGIGTNTASITANVDLGGNRIVQVGNNGVSTAADRDLTITGVISGTGNSFTKTDLGTLELTGGANTFTGNFQVTDGTVVLNKDAVSGVKGNATGVGNSTVTIGDNIRAANTAILEVSGDGLFVDQTSDQIANTATLVMNSDGKFRMTRPTGTDNFTETVGAIAGSGNIDLGYYSLIAGGNDASTEFSGTLEGQSTALFTKTGTGTLTISSDLGYDGNVDLTGGALAFNVDNAFTGTVNVFAGTTLKLSDADLSIANLNFTGTGTITLDFSGSSTLNVTNLNIGPNVTVNVINWTRASDFFFATNWTGATQDVGNDDPMNQVVFAGWLAEQTKWQSFDDQITPVPEPSTYGAMLIGAMGSLLGYRRWRKTRGAARK